MTERLSIMPGDVLVPMTATKIMHDRFEWERRWLDIAGHMHAWQCEVLLPLMAKIRDRVEKRVDYAGWPTRDAAGDAQC